MNAPQDGDQGSQAPGDGSQPDDPYVKDAYARDPYEDHDPATKDPVSEALHDRAADPPPPPGTLPDPQALYEQPEPGPNAPDPRRWAPTPAPEPEGPSRRLPYGDDPATVQYTGVDGLLSGSPDGTERMEPSAGPKPDQPHGQQDEQRAPEDAFAHLFRDQGKQRPTHPDGSGQPLTAPPQPRSESTPRQSPAAVASGADSTRQPLPDERPSSSPESEPLPAPGPGPGFEAAHAASSEATPPPPEPDSPPPPPPSDQKPPAASGGGKAAGLLRSSAIMAAGTMVSRITGFVRSAMIVAALGAAVLGDTYQLAITLPTMLYVLTVGGGLNSVFVPQLVRAMKEDDDGGEARHRRPGRADRTGGPRGAPAGADDVRAGGRQP
jgi:putative peptidoglycan lipid II flippase